MKFGTLVNIINVCLYWMRLIVHWPTNVNIGQAKISNQFSSGQSLSHVQLFVTPWIAPHQAFLCITNSRSSLRLTSIESVMPSSHLILCYPLLLLPPIPPSIRVFSNESHLVSGNFQTFLIHCWSKFVKVGIEQRESRWMSERKGSLIKWFTWID